MGSGAKRGLFNLVAISRGCSAAKTELIVKLAVVWLTTFRYVSGRLSLCSFKFVLNLSAGIGNEFLQERKKICSVLPWIVKRHFDYSCQR